MSWLAWVFKDLGPPATAHVTPTYSVPGQSTKSLTGTPQSCPGHRKQGKPEQLSQPRGTYGAGPTEYGILERKRHIREKLENAKKPQSLVNGNDQCGFLVTPRVHSKAGGH